MPHAYTEDQLVEQPAIGLFAELGWTTVSALEETFGATGTLLRETKGEVVLVFRLRAALERLNAGRMGHHALPTEAITAAVDGLTRDRSAMSLEAANREVYLLLKEASMGTEVKKVARVLLDRLRQLLVLNLRQKSSARSQLKLTIEETLDTGLPRAYDKPLYEHVYESYPERDASTYATAA